MLQKGGSSVSPLLSTNAGGGGFLSRVIGDSIPCREMILFCNSLLQSLGS